VDLPDTAAGFLWRHGQAEVALVANVSERPCKCKLPFTPTRLRVLDHTTATSAMYTPSAFRDSWREWSSAVLDLPRHSYVRVEGGAR
jgi:hypothetical protein